MRDPETIIHPFTSDFDDYLHDESRRAGEAESISFPEDEEEIRAVLRRLHALAAPLTVQGARTGLAAGAVPHGGHVLNLSRQTRCLGLRQDERGAFFLRVQPGVVLSELRKYLKAREIPHAGWDEASLAALERLRRAPEQMFPTDPTETSACVGGMAACNASGARSFHYGAMRGHVSALRLVLATGEVLALRRGEVRSHGRHLALALEGGRVLEVDLPTYEMPRCKNASGYFVHDDMDAIDLIIGSDGTLGVISELELALMPAPATVWGASFFFGGEHEAVAFTQRVRGVEGVVAVEYFDGDALDILRAQRARSTAFAALDEPPVTAHACIYLEIHADSADEARAVLETVVSRAHPAWRDRGAEGEASRAALSRTWVARTDTDRERLQFFRHAVPESVNMLIDERRRTAPGIAKLGGDMAVPDAHLETIMDTYRTALAEAGLQSAVWGHIGDNHLHVNILPRTQEEFARGHELLASWARAVTELGGAVSAEHGVGKIKRDFLMTMYGEAHVREMARVKLAFDPAAQLGRGNLFDEALLDEERASGRDSHNGRDARVGAASEATLPVSVSKGGEA